jgi:hypothetical protein
MGNFAVEVKAPVAPAELDPDHVVVPSHGAGLDGWPGKHFPDSLDYRLPPRDGLRADMEDGLRSVKQAKGWELLAVDQTGPFFQELGRVTFKRPIGRSATVGQWMMALLVGMVGSRQVSESEVARSPPGAPTQGHIHCPIDPVSALDIEMDSGQWNSGDWLDLRAVDRILVSIAANPSFAGPLIEPDDHASRHSSILKKASRGDQRPKSRSR